MTIGEASYVSSSPIGGGASYGSAGNGPSYPRVESQSTSGDVKSIRSRLAEVRAQRKAAAATVAAAAAATGESLLSANGNSFSWSTSLANTSFEETLAELRNQSLWRSPRNDSPPNAFPQQHSPPRHESQEDSNDHVADSPNRAVRGHNPQRYSSRQEALASNGDVESLNRVALGRSPQECHAAELPIRSSLGQAAAIQSSASFGGAGYSPPRHSSRQEAPDSNGDVESLNRAAFGSQQECQAAELPIRSSFSETCMEPPSMALAAKSPPTSFLARAACASTSASARTPAGIAQPPLCAPGPPNSFQQVSTAPAMSLLPQEGRSSFALADVARAAVEQEFSVSRLPPQASTPRSVSPTAVPDRCSAGVEVPAGDSSDCGLFDPDILGKPEAHTPTDVAELRSENHFLTEQLVEASVESAQHLEALSNDRHALLQAAQELRSRLQKEEVAREIAEKRLAETTKAANDLATENAELSSALRANDVARSPHISPPVSSRGVAESPSAFGTDDQLVAQLRAELDQLRQFCAQQTEQANATILDMARNNMELQSRLEAAEEQLKAQDQKRDTLGEGSSFNSSRGTAGFNVRTRCHSARSAGSIGNRSMDASNAVPPSPGRMPGRRLSARGGRRTQGTEVGATVGALRRSTSGPARIGILPGARVGQEVASARYIGEMSTPGELSISSSRPDLLGLGETRRPCAGSLMPEASKPRDHQGMQRKVVQTRLQRSLDKLAARMRKVQQESIITVG